MKCDKSAILGLIIIIGFFIILSVVLIKNEKIFNRIFNNKNIEGNTGSKETKDYVNGKALIDATRRGATIKSRTTKSQMFDGDVSKGGDSPLEVEQVVEDDMGEITLIKSKTVVPLPPSELENNNDKCIELNGAGLSDAKFCKKLAETEKCGMCLDPDKATASASLGSADVPNTLTGICESKNWIPPSLDIEKKCLTQLNRSVCMGVKSCTPLVGKQEICAWCPVEGKAYVYDEKIFEYGGNDGKEKGQYYPKYPKLDKCDWPKIKLNNGKEIPAWLGWSKGKIEPTMGFPGPMIKSNKHCQSLGGDFPCLKGDWRNGKHSIECKEKMWKNTTDCIKSGTYATMVYKTRSEFGKDVVDIFINNTIDKKGSYIDMFNEMNDYSEKAKSNDYNKARLYKKMCNDEIADPCDDKYKDAGKNPVKNRPDKCINKLWEKAGCSTEGKYSLTNIHKLKTKGLIDDNDYNDIMYKLPSRELLDKFRTYKSNSDKYERETNINTLKDPEWMDNSIFWQESCQGKLSEKTKNVIGKDKCWADFKHIMKNAHGVTVTDEKLVKGEKHPTGGKLVFKADPIGVKAGYMSDNNRKRSVMLNNDQIGQNWGENKEITKEMYEKPNFPYWKFIKHSSDIYSSSYEEKKNGKSSEKALLSLKECEKWAKTHSDLEGYSWDTLVDRNDRPKGCYRSGNQFRYNSMSFDKPPMKVATFATIPGFTQFVNDIRSINPHDIWIEGGTSYRIRVDGELTNMYNKKYGTSGPLPGTYNYTSVSSGVYFYATWAPPTQDTINKIYALLNKDCGSDTDDCIIKKQNSVDIISWEKFKIILAGDGKTLKDFEDLNEAPEKRQGEALKSMRKKKIYGITGVTSPSAYEIDVNGNAAFSRIMDLYKMNPEWSAYQPVDGKCPDCSLVPCGQCQEGCSKGYCPDGGYRNNCPDSNAGKVPEKCDVRDENVITKKMFLGGYGKDKERFPYWEFIKIAKQLNPNAFK